MRVDIIAIDQTYPLDGTPARNFAVIRLPNGQIVRGEVDDSGTQMLLRAASDSGFEPTAPSDLTIEPPTFVPEEEGILEQAFEEPEEEEVIEWMKLPPTVLTPVMKKSLLEAGAPPLLTEAQLQQYVTALIEGMGSETPKPKITTQQSARVVQRVPPIRTVPMDEKGNPIVASTRGEIDAGEVVGEGERDEDGVASV